jgi:nucleoside-diphosphate-sugar epimerase
MMNMLVTGGTGFLGKALARRLVKEGHHITIIGRNEQVGRQLEAEGMTFVQADLSDQEAMIKACQQKDYVFHCGALSSPWGKYYDFYQTNVSGTKNIIAGCKEHHVKRLIHVSTPSIYAYYSNRENITEDSSLPKRLINHYAQTKYLAEQEIDQAYENGLPVITIRPRAIFGPGDNAIIPRLIEANDKIGVPIINDGRALIDFTYIDNVVDALLLCMNSPEHTLGQKYNITNGHPMLLRDILEKLFKSLYINWNKRKVNYHFLFLLASCMELFYKTFMLKKEPVLTKYTVSVLSHTQTLNIDAAKNDLGYEPRVSIDEGIQEFSKWWKEQEHDDKV